MKSLKKKIIRKKAEISKELLVMPYPKEKQKKSKALNEIENRF